MNKYEKTITVYDVGDGFMVEVMPAGDVTEVWLAHGDYGVKTLMFGVATEACPAVPDMDLAGYISDYKQMYFDD